MSERTEVLPGVFINPQVIDTATGKIEYDLTEGSGPVVLVSHGGIGGVDQARVLANWVDTGKFRILSPSRPGYLGTPLDSGKTIEEQADLFAALLDELKIDKAAVISASAGGPPAYMFAIRHPDRVRALVAIDSVSGFYDMPETAGAIAQAIFTTQFGQKLLKKIGESKPEMFLQEIFQSEAYFTKAQQKAHIEYVLGSPVAVEFMRAFMATMNPYNARKPGTDNDMVQYSKLTHLPVEQIKCPSLIVHGTHDADVKFYDGVYAYEHIPHCERFWIEEGSHLGFWLCPNSVKAQKTAVNFLDKHRMK
jgi:pimeloyl-ACP methyl ester carboxylesterase